MDLYLKTKRCRYHRGNRTMKKRILDEFCETQSYHRKAAARLLRQAPIFDKKPKRPGKKKTYNPDVLLDCVYMTFLKFLEIIVTTLFYWWAHKDLNLGPTDYEPLAYILND